MWLHPNCGHNSGPDTRAITIEPRLLSLPAPRSPPRETVGSWSNRTGSMTTLNALSPIRCNRFTFCRDFLWRRDGRSPIDAASSTGAVAQGALSALIFGVANRKANFILFAFRLANLPVVSIQVKL